MATPNDDPTDGEPPRQIHIEGKEGGINWFAWLALAAGLLALLFALSRCDRDDDDVIVNDVDNEMVATEPDLDSAVVPGASGLAAYLGGSEALPRTFAFERLNFDTASSEIRNQDREEVASIAEALTEYPESRIRVVGFADARGDAAANSTLGRARAESVKDALVDEGIDAERIETASGGENAPAATNASPAGQAENRRTELVVLQR